MKHINIDSSTSVYCLIGDPVSHSLSPVMHNTAFAHIGYNAAYLAFNVKDPAGAVAGIRALGIKGASVTIPHKVSVIKFLDEIDEDALKIGAVNTIINKDGKLFGYNSDCLGAMAALSEKVDIKNKKVVLVGAGGAARAIGFGVLFGGGNLTVLNILEDEGKTLARDLGVDYYPLSHIDKINCEILINATPVGMYPNIDAMPVEEQYLKEGMTVMDIVYNPLKTKLLKKAEEKGCITVDGASMFVYQGVSQFETWTGQKAPVGVMRSTVLNAL